ncbi:Odorant receptor 95 [Blattella germanica]|nr:Odorant receptor 95 [Blattella germanica]
MKGRELSEKRFRKLFLMMRGAGIPLYMKNTSIFFKVYSYLVTVCMLCTIITIFIGTVTNSDCLKRIMQNVRVSFAMLDMSVAYIFIRFFHDRIEYLISLTEEFTWDELPKSNEFRMTSWIERVQTLGKYICIIVLSYHYIQSTVRIITLQEIVFDAWFPFDTSVSPTFEIIIFFQLLASVAIICIFAGYLPLNCIFIAVACSQLENLAFELKSLKQNCEIEEQLRNWILYHQKTLRFVKAIEDMLSTYIGVQMIPLYLGPCLSAFSAITSWNDFTDQTQAFVAVSVFFCQASVLCWFGTQLTESAENVKRAAWECDWIGAPIPMQKTILFIISRGNKDTEITAGKFVPLSNVTLLHMMNDCVSIFMFLLNVKERKERQHD